MSSAPYTPSEFDCEGTETRRRSWGTTPQSFDWRFVGLTGTPQQIAAVAQQYGAYYEPRKRGPRAEDYVMDHSTYLYLMDAEGKFVRGLNADTPGERIAEAVRSAMAKARENASH